MYITDIGGVLFIFQPETEKCRGFGFVTYSMEEDAQRALKEIKEYDGQKLSLTVAKSKIKDKNKKGSYEDMFQNGQLGESCVSMVTLHLCHLAPTEAVTAPKENQQKGSKKKLLKARLIIRNLSFKVQYVSWLLNVTAQSTLTETFANTPCVTVHRGSFERSICKVWDGYWGQNPPQTW